MAVLSTSPAVAGPRPVAPWWHTALLLALFLGLTVAGGLFQSNATSHPGATATHPPLVFVYLPLLLSEWGMVLYVWKAGLRRTGTPLRELIGGAWGTPQAIARDVALAVALWTAWHFIELGLNRALGTGDAASIDGYLPQRIVDGAMWVLLSLSAGFCEEVVFRGYLQRQFAAWTGSPVIALLLQAAVFGISHGYQGVTACAKIACFGVCFGLVALWRRSLRPGMVAHALTDILGGLLRI